MIQNCFLYSYKYPIYLQYLTHGSGESGHSESPPACWVYFRGKGLLRAAPLAREKLKCQMCLSPMVTSNISKQHS